MPSTSAAIADEAVERRLVEDLLAQAPNVILGTSLLAFFNAWFYWHLLPSWVLTLWLSALAAATAMRMGTMWRFRRDLMASPAAYWLRWLVLSSALLGMAWGGLSIAAVLSTSPEVGVVAIITVAGVVGSAAATSSASLTVFFAMSLLALLPLAAALLGSEHLSYRFVGALTACYVVVLARAATRIHQTLRQSIHASLQNDTLIAKLERQSRIDALTGLLNRRALDQGLESAWRAAGERQRRVGLVLCDVDHFKLYNDTLGHVAGDDCLKEVARVIASVVRSTDQLVARYGGEEFAVLLPNCDESTLKAVTERVREAVEQLEIAHPTSGTSRCVTVSAGGSQMIPEPGTASDGLLRNADRALYLAKSSGRNCTRFALG